MVAHGMAFGNDRVINRGMLFHVLPQAEKGGFSVVFSKQLEEAGGAFGMGAVIKGKEYSLPFTGNNKLQAGKKDVA